MEAKALGVAVEVRGEFLDTLAEPACEGEKALVS